MRYDRSRSFNVIEIGTNRKPKCDFLLVFYSNYAYLLSFLRYNVTVMGPQTAYDVRIPCSMLLHCVRTAPHVVSHALLVGRSVCTYPVINI